TVPETWPLPLPYSPVTVLPFCVKFIKPPSVEVQLPLQLAEPSTLPPPLLTPEMQQVSWVAAGTLFLRKQCAFGPQYDGRRNVKDWQRESFIQSSRHWFG